MDVPEWAAVAKLVSSEWADRKMTPEEEAECERLVKKSESLLRKSERKRIIKMDERTTIPGVYVLLYMGYSNDWIDMY